MSRLQVFAGVRVSDLDDMEFDEFCERAILLLRDKGQSVMADMIERLNRDGGAS